MNEIILGISPCPNDVYIFSGLLLNKVDLHGYSFKPQFKDVENLNQDVQSGLLDAAKISAAALPSCGQAYTMLPCGGALGRGVGPLLLSQQGTWNRAKVTLSPGRNTTANFLLQFYAGHHDSELSPASLPLAYLPFDELYAELCNNWKAQGVVIHEKRFTYQSDGLRLIEDLGDFWEQKTGYPIPLGALVVKPSSIDPELMTEIVRNSLAWANAHYDEAFALCRMHAQDLTPGVIESHISLYVNDYSMSLGDEGHKAIDHFLQTQRSFTEING